MTMENNLNKYFEVIQGMQYVGIYIQYLYRAYANLDNGNYFEAASLCCIGLDVMLHDMLDIQTSSFVNTSQEFTELKKKGENWTSGKIVGWMNKKKMFPDKLGQELQDMVDMRNGVIHPRGPEYKNKKNLFPAECTKEDAERFIDKLSAIIEDLGGRTPRQRWQEAQEETHRQRKEQERKRRFNPYENLRTNVQ